MLHIYTFVHTVLYKTRPITFVPYLQDIVYNNAPFHLYPLCY